MKDSWRILACPSADMLKNPHYTQKHSHPPEIQLVTKCWPHQSQPTISWQQTTQKIVVAPKGCPEPAQPTTRPNLVHSCLHWNPLNKKSRKDQHQNTEIHIQMKEQKRGPASKLDPREDSWSLPRPSPIRSTLRDFKPIKGLNPPGLDQTFSFSGQAEARGQGELSHLWSQIQMDLLLSI